MMAIKLRLFMSISMLLFRLPLYLCEVATDVKICGFKQSCAENGTVTEQAKGSCCKPCECGHICKERDSCCFDQIDQTNTSDIIGQECLPAVRIPKKYNGHLAGRYFTRSKCPVEFKDSSIKEKCENGTVVLPEDIPFVSSQDGKMVYKNRFCAICHGEENPVPWKTMVDFYKCDDSFLKSYVTGDTVVNILQENDCPLYFREPDDLDIERVGCFEESEVISECNKTKKWKTYDSEVERLCIQSPGSVYYFHEITVYSNLYCYLCNEPFGGATKYCPNLQYGRDDGKSLFALINQEIWSKNIQEMEGSSECKINEIFDTFFGKCRNLYCPMLNVPVSGKCQPFMDTNIPDRLVVKLESFERVNKSEAIINEIKSTYLSIKRKLGFGSCRLCSVSMYAKKDIDYLEVFVDFSLERTEICNQDLIWTKFTKIEISPASIKMMLSGKLTRFAVHWTNETKWHIAYFEEIQFFRPRPGFCNTLSVKRGTYCPKVKLSTEEYNTVLEKHSAAKRILSIPGNDELNGTMFVCCDNYIMEKKATAGAKQKSAEKISLLVLILAIVI